LQIFDEVGGCGRAVAGVGGELRVVSTPLYQLKAEFFKTLGHPARIRILELLVERDRSVAELLPKIGLEASNLSQQLAVLRRAGVVTSRKQGGTVIYSLASADMAELMAVARKVLTGLLADRVGLLKDLRASARTAARAGR
jgi:ArsR family transcriptional regulator